MAPTTMNTNRPASCQDTVYADALSPTEARERLLAAVHPARHTESLTLHDCLDRVLADEVIAAINVPGANNAAMDGYAICGAELPATGQRTLRLNGSSFAGRPCPHPLEPGTAIRIMTGAVMPEGSDTVVIQEHTETLDNGDAVRIGTDTVPGANVRAAGEDIRRGEHVFAPGIRLGPAELGVIASLGIDRLRVYRRLRVAFFSTGDELRPVNEPLEPGQIHDSNRYTLYGMLKRLGVELIDLGIVPDQLEPTRDALCQAAQDADVVLSSGGVSVGDADLIRDVMQQLGELHFWKVAMKPGRPLSFGKLPGAVFFGLPGNPVSVMVTFFQFVQPALKKMMGMDQLEPLRMRALCQTPLRKRPGREEYVRGILETDAQQQLTVCKAGAQGSGILRSMTRANCFILLPMDCTGVSVGDSVTVQPFWSLA